MRHTLACSFLCVASLAVIGCKPDEALKKGEVIDRGVHHTGPAQTTPENRPSDSPPAAPVTPK